jgi:hypothetical protein
MPMMTRARQTMGIVLRIRQKTMMCSRAAAAVQRVRHSRDELGDIDHPLSILEGGASGRAERRGRC